MDISLSTVSVVLLTYTMHSVVACLAAFGAARVLDRPRDRDVLWKTALLAPCFTAALAVALGSATLAWPAVDLSQVVRALWARPLPDRNVTVMIHKIATGTSVQRTVIDPVDNLLSIATMLIVGVTASIALYRLTLRYRALSKRLVDRLTLDIDAANRISLSDNLPTPVALGRNEICLPTFVARDFDDAQRAALIAHETAHLERQDPFWFAVIDVIGALSSFQPLARRAIRAFRHNAELICDEAAVRATHDRRALIGALAALAAPYDQDLAGAPAARATADARPLVARAERIATVDVDGADSRTTWLVVVAVIACGVALSAVPTVRPAPRDPFALPQLPALTRNADVPGRRIVERTVIRTREHVVSRPQ